MRFDVAGRPFLAFIRYAQILSTEEELVEPLILPELTFSGQKVGVLAEFSTDGEKVGRAVSL